MYSRIPRQPPKVWGEPSYRRQDAVHIQPPPNYSGSVFPLSAPPAEPEERTAHNGTPDATPNTTPASDMWRADRLQSHGAAVHGGPTSPSAPLLGSALPMGSIRPDVQGRDIDGQGERDTEALDVAEDMDVDTTEKMSSSGPFTSSAQASDTLREEGAEGKTSFTTSSTAETAVPASLPTRGSAEAGPLFQSAHFPLGHGLGQEELWILGLILLLLHEDPSAGDHNDLWETLLLLGVLLLCG